MAGGGVILFACMLLANGGNYGLNVALGRWLDPAQYGDVALMVTIMLLTTVLTTSAQLICATLVSQAGTTSERSAVVAHLRRRTLVGSAILAGALLPLTPMASNVLNVSEPLALAIMVIGLPVHLRMAVDRGVLQGDLRLSLLAGTFLVEAVARVVATLVLVSMGFGVLGATIGLNLGFVAALALAATTTRIGTAGPMAAAQRASLAAAQRQISVLLVAVTIINNGDVFAAKWLLDPSTAGRYAAIALVGRAVFFFSWSIQQAVVPMAARLGHGDKRAASFDRLSLGLTALVAFGLAGSAWLVQEPMVRLAFGVDYVELAFLLGPYAFATACFAVANVAASIEASRGRGRAGRFVLVGAVLQTAGVVLFGANVTHMVVVQVVVMGALVVALLVDWLTNGDPAVESVTMSPAPSVVPATNPVPTPARSRVAATVT